MRQNFLKYGLVLVFIAGLLGLFVYFNITRPRVLILHSYNTEYSWTRDLNVGLRRVLDQYSYYAIRWHYMDTKRHPDPHFKRVAGISAQRAIEQWQPHVVIAVDDDAQEYAAKYFVNHPAIHIVFAGVNGETEAYGYPGAANVTGILERKQLTAVTEVAQLIAASRQHSTAPRILHLGDRSGSVKEDAAAMERHDWKPVRFVGSRLVEDFEEWQQILRQAPAQADILLVTNYRKLARSPTDKTLVSSREVMQWTNANTKLPIVGTNLFNVEDGADLAVGVSPYEQGEVAARMAVEIIEEQRTPKDIPIRTTQQFIISMRKQGLADAGIRLPSVYEAFARATNNFFETPVPASQGQPLPPPQAAIPSHIQVPPPVEPEPAAPAKPAPTAAAPVPTPSPAVPASTPAPAAPAPSPAPQPKTARLEIQAKQLSWVEVWDSSGKRLTAGARQPGSRLVLDGAPPLRVNLGNPTGVGLRMNGKVIDPRSFRTRPFNLE
jgi:ABC-type uncharacterized transport system substrate-binding protein